jgi:hypothetical protein
MPAARSVVEALLETETKRWRFIGMTSTQNGQRLEYTVRLRKKIPAEALTARLRASAGGAIRAAEVVPGPTA